MAQQRMIMALQYLMGNAQPTGLEWDKLKWLITGEPIYRAAPIFLRL